MFLRHKWDGPIACICCGPLFWWHQEMAFQENGISVLHTLLECTPGATVRHTLHLDRLWPPCCTVERAKAVPSALRSWFALLHHRSQPIERVNQMRTFYPASKPPFLFLFSLSFNKILFYSLMVWLEPMALCMLGKCTITKLKPPMPPQIFIVLTAQLTSL